MRYSYTGATLGAELTEHEQLWLKQNQPRLFYLHDERKACGYFSFSSQYGDLEKITTSYEIAIDFARLEYHRLPLVYEVGGRIRKAARLYNMHLIDLHQYEDNRLCLIRPDVLMKVFYNRPIEIDQLCTIIRSHLYWQAYFENHGEAPWPGEEHGWDWLKQYQNNGQSK